MIILLAVLMVACIVFVIVLVVHFNRARLNLTGTEIERDIYLRKSNPFNFGAKSNLHDYVYKYTRSPSNVFDNSKSFYLDEESYYFAILSRYGKVVYTKTGLDIEDLYNKFAKSDKADHLKALDLFDSKASPRGASVPKNLDSLFMHRMSYKPPVERTGIL